MQNSFYLLVPAAVLDLLTLLLHAVGFLRIPPLSLSFSSQRASLPSVGVCWRRSNPPWSRNPNRPNMKGKCNYPALFQINWTPPPINVELFLTQLSPLCARDHVCFVFVSWERSWRLKVGVCIRDGLIYHSEILDFKAHYIPEFL